MLTTICPNAEQLAAFQAGKLKVEELNQVAAHLETCVSCQTVVQKGNTSGDGLVRELRQAQSGDPFSDESGCLRAIARVEAMANGEPTRTRDDTADNGPQAMLPMKMLGKYQLLEPIGQGGMGTVYKAVHTLLKRTVAVKVLPPNRLKDPQAVSRFRREIEAAGRLDHPHIVRTSDADEADGQHFLVMEWLAGDDLSKYVREHGPLPVDQACDFIRQAALGLECAHEHGMVHRDVKPSNLFLTNCGPATRERERPELPPTVKVLDLGLALLHDNVAVESDLTGDGQVMGTYDYIAPEQATESHTVDARADIYSLGCTFYFLLTGKAPFAGKSEAKKLLAHQLDEPTPIESHRPGVAEEVVGIIKKMMAKDPASRYTSMREVAEACKLTQEGVAKPSPVEQAAELASKPGKLGSLPHKQLLGAASILLGLAAVVALVVGIIRITTPEGEIVIRTDDPDISFSVKKGYVVLEDKKTKRTWNLKVVHEAKGEYELEITDLEAGASFKTKRFAIKRGEENALEAFFIRTPPDDHKGTPVAAVGKFALEFGREAYVDIPSLKLDPTGDMTLEGYFTVTSITTSMAMGVHNQISLHLYSGRWEIGMYRGKEDFTSGVISGARASEPATERRRVHVAGIRTRDALRLYVDGKLAAKSDVPADGLPLVATGNKFQIAGGDTFDYRPKRPNLPVSVPFFGTIDQCRISKGARYDRDFTPANRFEADKDAIAVYHFDEGQGNKLTDATNNNHHGKIVGAKWVRLGTTSGAAPLTAMTDREVAEWVLSKGGTVSLYQHGSVKLPLPNGELEIGNITFQYNKDITDDDLRRLAGLKKITSLQLSGCSKITDVGISHLAPLKSLGLLNLLAVTSTTPTCLDTILTLAEITELHCPPGMTDADLARLKAMKNLAAIGADRGTITDAGLVHLKDLPKLVAVTFGQFNGITDRGAATLAEIKSLHLVHLSGTSVTEKGWRELAKLPKLASVLPNGPYSEELMRTFAGVSTLKHVNSWHDGIHLELFKDHPSLAVLSLTDPKVGDDRIPIVVTLKKLADLNIKGSKITREGFEKLKAALSKCRIDSDYGTYDPAASPLTANRFTNSLGIEFALVPKGKAWFGGMSGTHGTQESEMEDDFYLGVYEVTQDEWRKVMSVNPSHFSRKGKQKDAVKDISDADLELFPVDNVSWDDCQEFLARLNDKCKEKGWTYRLPTEKEWQYACRGGSLPNKEDYAFNYYFQRPTNTLLPDKANFDKNVNRPQKVGSYEPNRLGLHDMHGNMAEWVDDLVKDAKSNFNRGTRGGGWGQEASWCRAVFRVNCPQSSRWGDVGLRVARVPAMVKIEAAPVGEIRRYLGHRDRISCVAFSPDGKSFLSGSWGELWLWDVDSTTERIRFPNTQGNILSAAFSLDGKRVVGPAVGSVALWETTVKSGEKPREIVRFKIPTWIEWCALSPDRPHLLYTDRNGGRIYDIDKKAELPTRFLGERASLSKDGRRLLTGDGRTLYLWDVDTGQELSHVDCTASMFRVALAPDGRHALAAVGKNVLQWDIVANKPGKRLDTPASVHALAISPDGKRALTGGFDKKMRLWDLATGTELYCFEGHTGPVSCVAFAPNGRQAISGSEDKTIRLWQLP